MVKKLQINDPSDGFTPEEEEILNTIGDKVLYQVYKKLPTSRMKAVVALHFECGYTQEQIARIFGVKQPMINQEIVNIRKVLKGDRYKPHRHQSDLSVNDVMELFMHLSRA
jgi:predicted DNA-binding protein YlxM (UPF0122 family)